MKPVPVLLEGAMSPVLVDLPRRHGDLIAVLSALEQRRFSHDGHSLPRALVRAPDLAEHSTPRLAHGTGPWPGGQVRGVHVSTRARGWSATASRKRGTAFRFRSMAAHGIRACTGSRERSGGWRGCWGVRRGGRSVGGRGR